jgi:hypothetical protein
MLLHHRRSNLYINISIHLHLYSFIFYYQESGANHRLGAYRNCIYFVLFSISLESLSCRKLFIGGSTSLRKIIQNISSKHKNMTQIWLY